MMSPMEWALVMVSLAFLGVAAVSRRLVGTPITPAMLFVGFGLLVGPKALDGIDMSSTGSVVRILAEATLALVLFSDASRVDLSHLRRAVGVPLRLLAVGLPLTILLGAVAAAVLFGELTAAEAVILGIVLAPTDAALGQAVVTEPRVPQRIRQGLNVESGLNDGICVPLLFAAVAVADLESDISGGRSTARLLFEEIGYGVAGGVIAGVAIAVIIRAAGRRDLIATQWYPVIPAAGAGLAYGIASALGGSGFIAAFVAGVVFRLALGRDPEQLNRLTEEVGDVLSGVTFILFGALLLGPTLTALSWQLDPLRGAQPDAGAHDPGRDRDVGHPCGASHAGLPRVVRPSRPGIDRIRRDRGRGVTTAGRAPDRARRLPDRRALRARPRPHGRPACRPLRDLVRVPSPGPAPGHGKRCDRDDPATRPCHHRRVA